MLTPAHPTLAIVGVTGAVGREFLQILESRSFPHGSIKMLASTRSAGMAIEYRGEQYVVEELTAESFAGVDFAFFSAGGTISKRYASVAVEAGATVIDNSSWFRMSPDVPLVVPEVNGEVLDEFSFPGVIANPNCSTAIALTAVTPLHRAAGIKRMVVSTYQAASGAGAAAMAELEQQARDFATDHPMKSDIFGRQYLFNLFSHDSAIGDNGYNEEEMKLVRETHKIWNNTSPAITATCVRVPVLRAHCEAINLSFDTPLGEDEAREILSAAPGVAIVDDRELNRFPEPLDAAGGDDVLVGRIRADISQPEGYGLDLFVAGDQLRKGAALNAVQIAERLVRIGSPV